MNSLGPRANNPVTAGAGMKRLKDPAIVHQNQLFDTNTYQGSTLGGASTIQVHPAHTG